jgi:hypothetical protein
MKRIIIKIIRKRKHIRYTEAYLSSLRWEIINIVTAARRQGLDEDDVRALNNRSDLINKYERRKRLLKF